MSYVHTNLSNLTDAELLNHIDSIRHYSPIIAELCKRLDALNVEPSPLHDRVTCPVCQAELRVDSDDGNEKYELAIVDD